MKPTSISQFYHDIAIKSDDKKHYDKLHFNIEQYKKKLSNGKSQFANLEANKEYLHRVKHNAMVHMGELLESFEYTFEKNGGKLLWADTAEDAVAQVIHLCRKHSAKMVVKSKSMVSEEIELNYALKRFGIEAIETDLGEFIQQLQGEPPYHILTPAMHKSKEDVAKLFHEKFNCPPNLSPGEITDMTRFLLREKFLKAKVGITGGNFIVADTGSLVLTENEGNGRMVTSLPDVHIAIVGIEKIIPKMEDLSLFLSMLATHGTGQLLTSYNTIFNGPIRREDGKLKSLYVILLNNGRTNLLADPDVYSSLFCIRCGACLNACPVYKTIGGHAYGTTYSGPIGAVISPHLRSMEEFGHLSFASSLCGACSEVCPVNIPLHNHLLSNRSKMIKKYPDKSQKQWQMWKKFMTHRWMIDITPRWIKNSMIKKYAKRYSQSKSILYNKLSKKSMLDFIKKRL